MIEPLLKRSTYLKEVVSELGLDNVEVVRARAEDWRRGPVLDAATARAVSALRTLVPLTAPLVRDGGELILLKGANASLEIESAEKVLRKYGVTDVRLEVIGEDLLAEPTRVVRATVR